MASRSLMSVAGLAMGLSCAFAAWMIVEMAFLLLHRRTTERRQAADAAREVAVVRDMLRALDPDAASEGFTAFNAASTDDRLRAARALIQLVKGDDRERLFEISEKARLFDGTIRLLDDPKVARRMEGVRELELFGSPVCVDGLRRCLDADADPSVRLAAAVALSNLGVLPDARWLFERLAVADRPLTRMHAGLFRSMAASDPAALSALGLEDAYRAKRPQLVDALGWAVDFAVLATLERHAADADEEVRCAALRAARRIGHPAVSSWVTALLLDPSEPVRIQAVQACGELGLRETVPVLLSLLRNQSWWVRMRAGEALERLGAAVAPHDPLAKAA